jgi:hypothetical protein
MSISLQDLQSATARIVSAAGAISSSRSVDSIIESLAETAARWLPEDSPWRARIAHVAPSVTGYSEAMVQEAVTLTFAPLTKDGWGAMLDSELGNRRVLDGFHEGRMARGPAVITHVLAGNVPPPGIVTICIGLLLKSANLVKMSSRDTVFPKLFEESLREVDPELAGCLAVLEWSRQDTSVTREAIAASDAVIAYGDEGSLQALRQMAPENTRFAGYGPKVSLAVVTRDALSPETLPQLAADVAFDVSMYDQQGCLSPHVVYVEEGSSVTPRKFAEALSVAMADFQARAPRGMMSVDDAAQFERVRTGYEFRSSNDRRIAVWASRVPNQWAVIYDDEPSFALSCLNRLVYVKPTDGLKRVVKGLHRFKGLISCVGVATVEARLTALAGELAGLGVSRICPVGQMQRPPLTWHHDGRPHVADLVTWTDLE